MSIFDWFDAKPAQAFGAQLAAAFAKAIPPDTSLPEKRFAQNAEAALKKMNRQITDFKNANTLNVYKKAQLSNSFKWNLKDAGFDNNYVARLTEWLVHRL